MGLVPDAQKKRLKEKLDSQAEDEVRLIVFTQENECQFCRQTRELVHEVAHLSEKITAQVFDFVKDSEKVKEYRIDKVPAIAVIGKKDYGIRYYGIPYGYEFASFIDSIVSVSKGTTNLLEETKRKLRSMEKPVHVQVFVTLTCPYCPIAAGLAHKFALESNGMVRSDVIDVTEFPHLAQKYSVMGVPKIIIDKRAELVGAIPEAQFVAHVLQAQKSPSIYI